MKTIHWILIAAAALVALFLWRRYSRLPSNWASLTPAQQAEWRRLQAAADAAGGVFE